MPAAVGVAAKKDPSSGSPPNRRDRGAQAELVAFRAAARWWSLRPLLTKDKVAAQHSQSCRRKCTGERDEQRSVTVRTRAVGQDEAIVPRIQSAVKKASNRKFPCRIFAKLLAIVHNRFNLV